MRIRVLGIGMGPQHVTREVAEALREVDYVLCVDKGGPAAPDPLLALRREIAASHGLEVVAVADPARDRDDPTDYDAAVRDWHDRRVDAFEEVLRARGGTAALLVWGDPALYDSTIRVVDALAARMPLVHDVLPGISAPQVLAARHRIVLHPIGRAVHVTTARRLHVDVAAGQTNLVVMLGSDPDLAGLEEWSIWWGANLGASSEELLAGRVGVVLDELRAARARAREAAGWVMDTCLLRAP